MRNAIGGRLVLGVSAVFGFAASASACNIYDPTDLACGTQTTLSVANPNNPSNPNSIYNPYSPFFSQPVYAYGIFGLLEKNPTVIYPAGPPRLCHLGVDCPQDASAQPTGSRQSSIPPRHRRHHQARSVD